MLSGKKVCQHQIILTKLLGKGAFGSVYQGINQITKEIVAVKVMEKSMIKEVPILKTLFPNEIKTLKILDSTNIVKYVADEETPERYFLAMEFCGDGDLAAKLQREGRFKEQIALGYFCQILNAFQEMHKKGVIHRDIKLENIMISQQVLKLVDFGFSKKFLEQNLEKQITNTILGTPIYMAPELLLGRPYKVLQTEIYALGVLLYLLLTGVPPFVYPNMMNQDDIELAKVIKKGKIKFDFQVFSISEELLGLLKRMLAYKNRISFKELYQNPLISEIINITQFRNEGMTGIGVEFNPKQSIYFYQNYEKTEEEEKQQVQINQKLTCDPPQQRQQIQFSQMDYGPPLQFTNPPSQRQQTEFNQIEYGPPQQFTDHSSQRQQTQFNQMEYGPPLQFIDPSSQGQLNQSNQFNYGPPLEFNDPQGQLNQFNPINEGFPSIFGQKQFSNFIQADPFQTSNQQTQNLNQSVDLVNLFQKSNEKQQQVNEAQINVNIYYEQYLNLIILLSNNFHILQQSTVGYVNSHTLGQAFLLVKIYLMAFRFKNDLENDQNIFKLKKYQDIQQNIQFKILKNQVQNHYYPSIEINFNCLIEDYIAEIKNGNKKGFFKNFLSKISDKFFAEKKNQFIQFVQKIKQSIHIDEKEFEKAYYEQMKNYYLELKQFLEEEENFIKKKTEIQNNGFEKLKNLYKILLAVLQSIEVEKQFPAENEKAFNFLQFSEKCQETFKGEYWLENVKLIQQEKEKFIF